MDCPNMVEYRGERTFSDYIPGYAQGAYFPDDMPGIKCRETGEYCPVDSSEDKRDCDCTEDTSLYCPKCVDRDELHWLVKFPDGTLLCKHCDFVAEDKIELLDLYADNIDGLMQELKSCKIDLQAEKEKKDKLETALKSISKLIPERFIDNE